MKMWCVSGCADQFCALGPCSSPEHFPLSIATISVMFPWHLASFFTFPSLPHLFWSIPPLYFYLYGFSETERIFTHELNFSSHNFVLFVLFWSFCFFSFYEKASCRNLVLSIWIKIRVKSKLTEKQNHKQNKNTHQCLSLVGFSAAFCIDTIQYYKPAMWTPVRITAQTTLLFQAGV